MIPAGGRAQGAAFGALRSVFPVLLVALGLRLFPFTWGAPPQIAYADELYHVEQALALFDNPRIVLTEPYTPLYDRLLSATLLPAWIVHRAGGMICGRPAASLAREWREPGAGVFYLGRILSALFDAAAVVFTFLLAMLLFGEIRAALLAALLHAFAFEMVRHGHYAVPDSLSLLLSNATLFTGLRFLRCGVSRPGAIGAGALAALAASAKFNNLLLAPAVLGLALLAPAGSTAPLSRGRRLFFIGAAFLITLAAVFPALPHFVRQEILANRAAAGSGGLFRLGSEGGIFALFLNHYPIPHEELSARSLWSALSVIPVLAGVIGLVIFTIRKPLFFVPLLLFTGLTLLPAARVNIVRYAMPAFPFILIAAAGLAFSFTAGYRHRVFVLAGLMLLAGPVFRAARLDVLLAHKDSRVIAGEWVASHIPKGATLALYRDHFWSNPMLRPADYRIVNIPFVLYGRDGLERDRARPLEAYRAEGVEFFLINDFMTGHHLNPATRARLPAVVESYEGFYASLDRACELVYRYDKNGWNRPGPSIRIYKVRRPGSDG